MSYRLFRLNSFYKGDILCTYLFLSTRFSYICTSIIYKRDPNEILFFLLFEGIERIFFILNCKL